VSEAQGHGFVACNIACNVASRLQCAEQPTCIGACVAAACLAAAISHTCTDLQACSWSTVRCAASDIPASAPLAACRDSSIPLTCNDAQLKQDHQGCRVSSAGGAALWASLLRSSAVWAIVVNNFAFHYAFYLVMNWLPTYFNRCVNHGCLLCDCRPDLQHNVFGQLPARVVSSQT
jgi:hypothetical protein